MYIPYEIFIAYYVTMMTGEGMGECAQPWARRKPGNGDQTFIFHLLAGLLRNMRISSFH